MGVPASCTPQASDKKAHARSATGKRHSVPEKMSEAAYAKAKDRIAARSVERVEARKRGSGPAADERKLRDQYTIVRGWKPKKRRHCGVGGGLKDAWGVWDVAVDMTSEEQPHRTALIVPKSLLITRNDEDFRERINVLLKLRIIYDIFCEENEITIIYDIDPEEEVPVLETGTVSEEAAASWMRTTIRVLLECHSSNIHIGASALTRVVGESLESSSLIGLGVLGYLIAGPWELPDEEIGKDWLMFVAPELLKIPGSSSMGELSDAWSLGMLLYSILSGGPPIDSRILRKRGPRTPVLEFSPTFEGESWREVSAECIEFIRSLLTHDPRRRCSLAYALYESQWLQPAAAMRRSMTVLNELTDFQERAQRYQLSSALRRAARRFAVEQMSRSSLARLEKTFRRMDKNNDGLITVDEVRTALKEHLIEIGSETQARRGEDDLADLFQRAFGEKDASKCGVDLIEFAAVLLDEHQLQEKETLLAAFRRFDSKNSGYITREQIAIALNSAGFDTKGAEKSKLPTELDQLVSLADANGDNRIDFEEFTRLLQLDGEALDQQEERFKRQLRGGVLWNSLLTKTCVCCSAEASTGHNRIQANR